jgi:glucose/arabinose dehydrogenase
VRRQTLFFPKTFFIALLFMTVFVAARPAEAQNPTQDAAAAPALELSTAQRQTVFQSVSKTQKNHAAPTGFRVSVGAHVPDAIELAAMPDTLATLIPEARGFSVAMVEKQVMIVDRNSRQVVAVVTEAH